MSPPAGQSFCRQRHSRQSLTGRRAERYLQRLQPEGRLPSRAPTSLDQAPATSSGQETRARRPPRGELRSAPRPAEIRSIEGRGMAPPVPAPPRGRRAGRAAAQDQPQRHGGTAAGPGSRPTAVSAVMSAEVGSRRASRAPDHTRTTSHGNRPSCSGDLSGKYAQSPLDILVHLAVMVPSVPECGRSSMLERAVLVVQKSGPILSSQLSPPTSQPRHSSQQAASTPATSATLYETYRKKRSTPTRSR